MSHVAVDFWGLPEKKEVSDSEERITRRGRKIALILGGG